MKITAFEASKMSCELDVIMYELVYGEMSKTEAYKRLGAISHKLWEAGQEPIVDEEEELEAT